MRGLVLGSKYRFLMVRRSEPEDTVSEPGSVYNRVKLPHDVQVTYYIN